MDIAIDVALDDAVELNSGGPVMTIIEIVTHGKNGGTDIVVWWRADDGKPQILEIDARCVRVVRRLAEVPERAEAEIPAGDRAQIGSQNNGQMSGAPMSNLSNPPDLLPPEERSRRTRLAWWASLTDEQRRELERAPERRSVPPGRGGATTGATTRAIRTTVASARLFDLLTPTDPDVIGWSPGELLYAEPEIRAKATHVVPLLPYHAPSVLEPYRDRAPRGLLAVLETPGDALVSFVVVEWASGPSDDGSIPNLYQPLFYGEGPSAPLRELRHTHWGHADDGYLHSPNGALIAAAFGALRRWFDCWRRT